MFYTKSGGNIFIYLFAGLVIFLLPPGFLIAQSDCLEHPSSGPSPYGTEVLLQQVPIVIKNTDLKSRAFEFKVNSSKIIQHIELEIETLFSGFNAWTILNDDGTFFDQVAGDGIYTTNDEFYYLRQAEGNYEQDFTKLFISILYEDQCEDTFNAIITTFVVNNHFQELDPDDKVYALNDSISYSSNLVNYAVKQQFHWAGGDFDLEQIANNFRTTWKCYEGSVLSIHSPINSNARSVFQSSGAFPALRLMTHIISTNFTTYNHELNHLWVNVSGLRFSSHHWKYMERNSTGFGDYGLGCANGVFHLIHETENGVFGYFNPTIHEDANSVYNDVELYLMGLIDIDSVQFPIKYVNEATLCDYLGAGTSFKLVDGVIDSFSKEQFLDKIETENLMDISDSLSLKFIFVTQNKLSDFEHLFISHILKQYPHHFEHNVANLTTVSTKVGHPQDPDFICVQELEEPPEPEMESDTLLQQCKIYPIPASDILYMELQEDVYYEIHIYDIVGRLIYSTISVNNPSLEINHLSQGIYIFRCRELSTNDIYTEAFAIIK